MPRRKPADPPPEPPTSAASRLVIALGAVAIAAAAIVSSLRPGAANWGLHAAGFLDPTLRNVLLAAMAAASAVVVFGLFARSGEVAAEDRPARRRNRLAILPWLLLAGWLAFGLWNPVKESLLGDSAILIQDVQAETLHLGSEPLSVRLLDVVADALRSGGSRIDQDSLGVVSRVAGVGAALLFLAIAFEIRGSLSVVAVLALLLTLGVSQLYFGYVESYPIALLFVLLYLWLGLRASRGATAALFAGVALGVAAAAHVTALLLFPSYVLLLLRGGTRARQAVGLLLPLAVVAAAFAALGYGIQNLAHPFRVAAQGAAPAGVHDAFLRPYPFLSGAHLNDVAHAALLAAPVALLLLLAAAIALRPKPSEWPAPVTFLGAAAIPGVLVVGALMTPVSPAQDWDLFAFLLAPAAVLGVAAAVALIPRALRGATGDGLVALSAALLLPFVLVNADSRASIARFGQVVGDSTRVAPYGRAYGNEILWVLHRDRGAHEASLVHARAAYEAEPTNPRYAINLGHALLALRRVEEAVPHFRAAAAAAPERWDAPFNLGLSYASLRRYPEALAALGEATRRDPERPEVWAAMVRALFASGQVDSAEVVWARLQERWPEYVEEQRRLHGAR